MVNKRYVKIVIFLLLLLMLSVSNAHAKPTISNPPGNITYLANTSGTTWILWTWTNPSIDFDHTEIYLDGEWKVNRSLNQSYNATSLSPKTSHTISLRAVDAAGNNGEWKNDTASTKAEKPIVIRISPSNSILESGIETKTFSIQLLNQAANVTWTGATSQMNSSVQVGDIVYITYTPPARGNYKISVYASNENGISNTITWNWIVRPLTYETGSRIWDGERYPDEFSTSYTWTPKSFSGFYYNLDEDAGSENIEIELSSRSHGTVEKNHIIYSTSPQEVYFNHEGWGKYQVIGFMGDKYFAGYKNHTITEATDTFDDISAMSQGQIHKVLYDDDKKRAISVGGTLMLKDGYVLNATDIDFNGRTMFLRLLKDGSEIDSNVLRAGETYVYRTKVGYIDDFPLILVRFDSVFIGTELQTAFLKGIFQVSEDIINLRAGNRFGIMEITQVNKDMIVMKNNDNEVSLNKGNTSDLFGNLKILVADSDDLRFALFMDRKGSIKVRSAVYDDNAPYPVSEWTPYNFGMNTGRTTTGFYYDIDNNLGTEKLSLTKLNGRSIPKNRLIYATEPMETLFNHNEWGRYLVTGFIGKKYFAGYRGSAISGTGITFDDISTMEHGQLHKILIDDDMKRILQVGGTITIREGYVLKAIDIDIYNQSISIVLYKNGTQVDSKTLKGGETYIYKKSTGNVDDLPLILFRFENVFEGEKMKAASLKGIFQISESSVIINSGDKYGRMQVTEVNKDRIVMKNKGTINLYSGRNNKLMGNINIKVANSDILRFFFEAKKIPEEMHQYHKMRASV